MRQGPIIEEPAQRYWRSQTNQRVRKLRIVKGALRWSGRRLDADGDEIRSNGWADR